MAVISKFRDNELNFHHTFDEKPDSKNFFMHAHDVFEILYVVQGKGTFRVEGVPYELCSGGVYITRPAETHHISIDENSAYERMAIHFTGSAVLPFDRKGLLLSPFDDRSLGRMNDIGTNLPDKEFFGTCFNRISSTAPFGHDKIISYLLPVLNEIGSSFCIAQNTPEQKVTVSSDLVDYINRHLFEDLSLDKISERFFISKSQVNRAFKKATGSSVWDYIVIKRLLSARGAIREGTPINEAFRASGFKDYSTFWRAYKSHFNCSPKDDS